MSLSEEGGRFLHEITNYRIIEVPSDSPLSGPGDHWLSPAGLRQILQSSNLASIHLRCVASLVLDILYPHTFGVEPAS